MEERSKIITSIFNAIYSGNFDKVEEKIRELNKDYDIKNLDPKQVTSLMTLFDFPIDKV